MSPALEHVRMMTVEQLRNARRQSYAESESTLADEQVYIPAIDEISSQITAYIGQHSLRKEREEVHHLRQKYRVVRLRGAQIEEDSFSVALDGDEVDPEAFTLYASEGWMQFHEPPAWRSGGSVRVEIEYTGGLAETPEAFAIGYPDLHSAAIMQAQYRLESRDSLGGSISVPQGMSATKFGEYNFLRRIQTVLDRYRRWSV